MDYFWRFLLLIFLTLFPVFVVYEGWWKWRDFRFVEKLAGYRIRGKDHNYKDPHKCRIDIGCRGIEKRVAWSSVKEVRRNKKAWMGEYCIIRILEFPGKPLPFDERARNIDYYLAGADVVVSNEQSNNWSLWTSYPENDRRRGSWSFRLCNSASLKTRIRTPDHSGYYYDCSRELYEILEIANKKHCIYQLALEQLQEKVLPLLESTKRSFKSSTIAACKNALELGTRFVEDNPYPEIVVEELEKKEKVSAE